ncbi:unnamed protein product [Dibothriocephalus latus]|uniref:Uncharacterized protein n=1 Tax=Dibothriocephalus latus TaxID=60516 RepID=A0A3P6NTZ9_DIBLA|nr:unnamed protein product [Dibothriocephalus latus]
MISLLSRGIIVANVSVPPNHAVLYRFGSVDAGHVQSVCTALLVFGTERTRINEWASEAQIENWFYAYLDLLARFRLWSVSTRIIKQCGNIFGGVDTWLSGRYSPGFDGRRRSLGSVGGATGASGNNQSKEAFQTRVQAKNSSGKLPIDASIS